MASQNETSIWVSSVPIAERNTPRSLCSSAHQQRSSDLARLIEGEAAARHDRTILHRIKAARFPLIKTLESFRWDWSKKINQLQIQDLFRLRFIEEKANAIFLGLCGLGTMPGTGLCRVA
jgi:DNA replication protein DnaC